MKYEVGQTYTGLLCGELRTFEVLEKDGYPSMYDIRWDDGEEEWAYEDDVNHWVQAARDKAEEERYL